MRRRTGGFGPALALLALLAAACMASAAASSWAELPRSDLASSPPRIDATPYLEVPNAGVTAGVTWDGTNITTAVALPSAFVVQGAATVQVAFQYTVNGSGPGPATAEIVLTYLGDNLTTTGKGTAGANGSGTAKFLWSFGSLVEATEGAFQLTAALVDANGTVLWSQGFYIVVEAPYRVGSGLFLFLIVLGAVEAYSLGVALQRRKTKHLPRPERQGTLPPPKPGTRSGGT